MAKRMTAKTTVKIKDETPDLDKLRGLVIVEGTEKSEYLKKGIDYEVSSVLAKRLIKFGHAKFKKEVK